MPLKPAATRPRPDRPSTAPPPEMVAVVDDRDRPIAILPLAEVHRQRLCHRSVLVLVFDRQGRLYLQRRAATKAAYPGCFDLSATGHVRAFESREDAGVRELREELGLEVAGLRRLAEVGASPRTGFEFVTLFTAGAVDAAPRPDPAEVSEGFFATPEDVEDMLEHFRELLTPALIHVHEQGLLFSGERRPA